jgi:hypothetical protein
MSYCEQGGSDSMVLSVDPFTKLCQIETKNCGLKEVLLSMLEQYQAELDRIHKDLGEKSRPLLPSLAELTPYDARGVKKYNQFLESLVKSKQILSKENDFFDGIVGAV